MDEADGGLLRPCSSRAVECVSKQPYLLKEEVDEELGVYRAKLARWKHHQHGPLLQ